MKLFHYVIFCILIVSCVFLIEVLCLFFLAFIGSRIIAIFYVIITIPINYRGIRDIMYPDPQLG